ncbi:MAG: hypothetical protein GX826_07220 [Gammaproteobacteria bacterium]|jgi:hypothetical protein|nr:hypothetical protein [Gammaproteobacteria bacterium]
MAMRVYIVGMMFLGLVQIAAPAGAAEETALREVERVGTSLHELDRAARAALKEAEGTRAFRRDDRVAGWVADRHPDGLSFTFVGMEPGSSQPLALYRTVIARSGRVLEDLRRLPGEPLDARLAAQFAASEQARLTQRTRCSNDEETLVLPAGDGWNAYVLPRAAFPDIYLLGGSYRIGVTALADAVIEAQPLASECVIVQDKAGDGALLFAEDRATLPNELHVYISQQAGKPLYVTTTPNGRTWLIQEGRIHPVTGIPASAG